MLRDIVKPAGSVMSVLDVVYESNIHRNSEIENGFAH